MAPTAPGPSEGSSLTVVHEGFAAPVEVLLAPRAALPQRRLLHVGLRLGLQPAPARQGDDAHDDGQPQQQGQEPPAPPAGEAAHHHRARPAARPANPGVAGVVRRGRSAGTGDCDCAGPSGVLRRRGGGSPTHIPLTKPAAAGGPDRWGRRRAAEGAGPGPLCSSRSHQPRSAPAPRPARPGSPSHFSSRCPPPSRTRCRSAGVAQTPKNATTAKNLQFSGFHEPCLPHGGWRSSSSSLITG